MLIETMNLELIYPDFWFLQKAISVWCAKESATWVEFWKTIHYKYNPIHNYDRTEDGRDLETRDLHSTNDDTHNLQLDKTDTHDLSYVTEEDGTNHSAVVYDGTDTTDKDVAGYNSSALTPRDRDTITYDSSDTTDGRNHSDNTTTDTGTINYLTKDTGTLKRAGSDTGTVDDKHDLRAYGNIGVTSTQELIKQQREIIDFNMVDFITDRFKNKFCLEVY